MRFLLGCGGLSGVSRGFLGCASKVWDCVGSIKISEIDVVECFREW